MQPEWLYFFGGPNIPKCNYLTNNVDNEKTQQKLSI